MDSNEDEEQMIEDCEKRAHHLTDWETTFIDSIRRRVDSGLSLTPRQAETLNNIWERVSGKPT